MENISLSVTVLLTGFAIVFAVLLALIGIIKLYGTIIYNIQTKKMNKAKIKVEVESPSEPFPVSPQPSVIAESAEEDDDALIAVISAAVYAYYSSSQVRIKSIRKASPKSNAWRSAGLADNVRPF